MLRIRASSRGPAHRRLKGVRSRTQIVTILERTGFKRPNEDRPIIGRAKPGFDIGRPMIGRYLNERAHLHLEASRYTFPIIQTRWPSGSAEGELGVMRLPKCCYRRIFAAPDV